MWAAILQFIASLLGFIPKDSPVERVTRTANDMAQTSAVISRETQSQTEKELQHVQAETDAAVASVHESGGVRGPSAEGLKAVADAIRRANGQPGAND